MLNSIKNISSKDKQLLYIVALIWGLDLVYYLKAVVLRIPGINLFADYFIPALVIVSLMICFKSISSKLKSTDYIFYFLFLVVYIFQFVVFPNNEQYLSENFFDVFFKVVPWFFLGLIIDEEKHLETLTLISVVYIVSSTFYLYFTIQGATNSELEEGERMGAAYSLLPHLLLVLYSTLKEFKIYKLIVVAVGIFMLLGTGNRGSLLLTLVFLSIYLIFCSNFKHKRLAWTLIASLLALVIIYQESLFDAIFNFIDGLGFNTRALRMLTDNEFFDDNGRDSLRTFFMQKIKEGGIFGYGICGDRTMLGGSGYYPHNIFLEFLIQYGIIIGSIMSVSLLFLSIKGFVSSLNGEAKSFLILLFVVGFVALLISNTYLSNPLFFFYIGLCVNHIRQRKEKNINNTEVL